MKKISVTLLVVCCFALFSFEKNEGVFYPKEHFEKELWYPFMINKLTKQDRADAHSAHWSQMLCSNSHIAFEKDLKKLIEKLGKVKEEEIRVLFRENKNDPMVYVFVETLYSVLDLFIFNTKTTELKRVENKGVIITHFGDRISLKENKNEGILFYDDYHVEGTGRSFRNHFYFNRKENSFKQTKNCEIINGVQQCKEAK